MSSENTDYANEKINELKNLVYNIISEEDIKRAQDAVHENVGKKIQQKPISSVLVALGVGFLLGKILK